MLDLITLLWMLGIDLVETELKIQNDLCTCQNSLFVF